MIPFVDGIIQWLLRHLVVNYPHKRRQQLASLGRHDGGVPRLDNPVSVVYEGCKENELSFRVKTMQEDPSKRVGRIVVALIDPGIIRVCAMPDGEPRLDVTWAVCGSPGDTPVEGRRRDDYSVFYKPYFRLEESSQMVCLRTAQLVAEISLSPFRITWKSVPDGVLLAEDAAEGAFRFETGGRAVRHDMKKIRRRFYGFGEKAGALNKNGRRLVMMEVDSLGYHARFQDPLYKQFCNYIALDDSGRQAYGLFYDNFAVSEFDLGRRDETRLTWTADAGDADYYFIYGPSIRDVVLRQAQLIGKPCLPPRWSLGYGGSSMHYTEAPDAQARLEGFLARCEEQNFPCDLFHLSSGYTTDAKGKRNVFEWNNSRVPDPRGLFSRLAGAGVHVSANIKPVLLTSHPRYAELDKMGAFIKGPGGKSYIAPFWGGRGSFIDFTNPKGRNWWKTRMKDSLFSLGVVSSWNDNNEFEAWNENCTCFRFGKTSSIDQMRPLLTYHMLRASFEAQREAAPQKRPFLLTRAASPGSQRYAQTWSGDNYASWSTLQYNIPMGAGLSLSGFSNFGHDAGGFSGFRPSPELFVRWVQNAALNPRFSIHSWHFDRSINEPWMYPKMTPLVRYAFELRSRLMPYLYSLFALSAATGEPIQRPMVYEFPQDANAAENSFDFLLGPSLLVASVYKKGERQRRVNLPAATDWLDFESGERYEGGRSVLLKAPLNHIPLLARGGAIIPMGPVLPHANHHPDDYREIRLFPSRNKLISKFILYEDDGESLAYIHGEKLELHLRLESSPERLDFSLSLVGVYRPDYSKLTLILPRGEERPLYYDGREVHMPQNAQGQRTAILGLPNSRPERPQAEVEYPYWE